MEEVIDGSSVKRETKHKWQVYQFYKEQCVEKVFAICLKDKKNAF